VHLAATAIVLLAFAGSLALCALCGFYHERLCVCCTAASERLRACCSAVRTRLAPAAGRRTAPLVRTLAISPEKRHVPFTDEKGSFSDSSTAGSRRPSTAPAGTRQPVPRDRPRPGRPSVPSVKALASLGRSLRELSFGEFSRRSVKERSFEVSFGEGHACSREPSGSQSKPASKVPSFEGGVSAGASREASGSREPSKRAFEMGEASRTQASCRTLSSDTLSESSRASAHRGEAAHPPEASPPEILSGGLVRRMLRDMERREQQEQSSISPSSTPRPGTVRRMLPPARGQDMERQDRQEQQASNDDDGGAPGARWLTGLNTPRGRAAAGWPVDL